MSDPQFRFRFGVFLLAAWTVLLLLAVAAGPIQPLMIASILLGYVVAGLLTLRGRRQRS